MIQVLFQQKQGRFDIELSVERNLIVYCKVENNSCFAEMTFAMEND